MMGPIKVVELEGKGRGVVATADMAPGDLIMVSDALACLRAPEGARPDGGDLTDEVLRLRVHTSEWFKYLYDGSCCCSEVSTRAVPDLTRWRELAAVAPAPTAKEDGGVVASSSGDAPAGTEQQQQQQQAQARPAVGSAAAQLLARKKKASSCAEPATQKAAAGASKGFGARVRGAAGRGAGAGAAGAVGSGLPGGATMAEARRASKVVNLNCFGDAHGDRAAAALRGEPVSAHIGVWPEFAMLNHSCSPNAINYALGSRALVVRAATHVAAGDEITISYLGRPQLVPVDARIELLREDYGFSCECERCTNELVHMDKLAGLYDELHREVTEDLGPLFLRAKKARDAAGVSVVRARLRRVMPQLYAAFRKGLMLPMVRNCFVASLYEAFELQMVAEEVGAQLDAADASAASSAAAQGAGAGGAPPAGGADGDAAALMDDTAAAAHGSALAAVTKAVAEVSPGSDLHVILAARRAYALRGTGTALQVAAAEADAVDAAAARYGRALQPRTAALLIELNRTLYD
ncbi:hypothetical protein FOA52_009680 [Chlamydomonas sp. UWO 241]|nr:hypothetical protein FOA52_009680 [Chlamydomonas sp. UWO 241]